MRTLLFVIVLALAACGTTNNAGGAAVPCVNGACATGTCVNNVCVANKLSDASSGGDTTGPTFINPCESAKCASQIGLCTGGCATWLACAQKCAAADSGCQTACAQKAAGDAVAVSAIQSVLQCVGTNEIACAAQADAGGSDGGDAGDTDGDGVGPHFSSLYADYLSNCAGCHAPGAVGQTSSTEKTLDFSSEAAAYSSLMGNASGLSGNQQACNGVAFVVKGKPQSSLVVATLDSATRTAFDVSTSPGCDANAISDMVFKTGKSPSAAFISALKTWVQNGAPND